MLNPKFATSENHINLDSMLEKYTDVSGVSKYAVNGNNINLNYGHTADILTSVTIALTQEYAIALNGHDAFVYIHDDKLPLYKNGHYLMYYNNYFNSTTNKVSVVKAHYDPTLRKELLKFHNKSYYRKQSKFISSFTNLLKATAYPENKDYDFWVAINDKTWISKSKIMILDYGLVSYTSDLLFSGWASKHSALIHNCYKTNQILILAVLNYELKKI